MAKQKNTQQITVTIPKDLVKILKDMAVREDRTFSYATTRIIRTGLRAYVIDPSIAQCKDFLDDRCLDSTSIAKPKKLN
jgi:transcriptional regulator of met regulon